MKDVSQGIANENIQEVLDAAVSAGHALQGGQNQFSTPDWLARGLAAMLPYGHHDDVFDPQCAGGNLLMAVQANLRCGCEIDRRFVFDRQSPVPFKEDEIRRITGSCVTVAQRMEEFFKDAKHTCIVANPPFAIRWQTDGDSIDSTEWTWDYIKAKLANYGCGFLISNANTLERLKVPEDPWVYLYQRFPAGGVWENCNVELGIVHFHFRTNSALLPDMAIRKVWDHVPDEKELVTFAKTITSNCYSRPWGSGMARAWDMVGKMMKEESGTPKFNIYLDDAGMLRTYLSTRNQIKFKREDLTQLTRINHCHPLTLTTERETRKLMHAFLTGGIYTIEPAARDAITAALAEVTSLACPIRPITDFETVAYADEEDTLKCKNPDQRGKLKLTKGRRYEVITGTYTFKEEFTRKKIYFDEESQKTEIEDHECELSGEDRYIQVTDDHGRIHQFMERPELDCAWHHPEALLWEMFDKPYVPSVAEVNAEQYQRNKELMSMNEALATFTYYDGQLDYYARMGCKDYGLIAAATGTGKSLGALTIIALKGPTRTLLIAPQGTTRSVGEEDEIDYQASQWVSEIQRFAPCEPVFQLFGPEDWLAIRRANGDTLPPGIYITYPQAYFSNGAFEHLPATWEMLAEKKFCERFGLRFDKERCLEDFFSRNVGGSNEAGIRCVATPSLATSIAAHHGPKIWDCIIIDEAHLCCNLDAQVTKNLLRMQPRYRFAMTATPIPNIVSNIFSLMGWLCVPNWYKGNIRNAAWPYSVDEIGRFNSTFLSTEVDLTAQRKARAQGKKSWRHTGTRFSPVISSPARLLKLLKPNLAYISKEACNPKLMPCEVLDVRVALGKEQAKLYAHWLDRKNYLTEFKSMLTIAMVQTSRLRGVCAAPASLDYTLDMCKSNFNPKQVMILQLVRDCLKRGEQVTVVSARVAQSVALASRLADAGVTIARIDSTVPASIHTSEANRFKRGDARVMLMGIKCAQGHSFEQCPNLIVGSLEWSYGSLCQAQGRVWRLNSPKPIKIFCVLHQNTIEELLFDRVALKQDAATLCLHGQRVPRDFKTLDADEVLAEHIVNYDAGKGQILSETECEMQWPALRKQLVMANGPRLLEAAPALIPAMKQAG